MFARKNFIRDFFANKNVNPPCVTGTHSSYISVLKNYETKGKNVATWYFVTAEKNAIVKTYRRPFNRLLLRNLIFWFVGALYLRRQVAFRGAVSAENERHNRVCKQYQDDLHRYWRRWHTIQYQFTESRISVNNELTLPIPFIFYSVSDW